MLPRLSAKVVDSVSFAFSEDATSACPPASLKATCQTKPQHRTPSADVPHLLKQKMGEKLRASQEEAKRLSSKVVELEADRAAMERQAENDADVTAERVRAAGQRITELQGLKAREREKKRTILAESLLQANVCETRMYKRVCLWCSRWLHHMKVAFAALCLVPNVFGIKSEFLWWESCSGAADRPKCSGKRRRSPGASKVAFFWRVLALVGEQPLGCWDLVEGYRHSARLTKLGFLRKSQSLVRMEQQSILVLSSFSKTTQLGEFSTEPDECD